MDAKRVCVRNSQRVHVLTALFLPMCVLSLALAALAAQPVQAKPDPGLGDWLDPAYHSPAAQAAYIPTAFEAAEPEVAAVPLLARPSAVGGRSAILADPYLVYYVAPNCAGIPAPCYTTLQAAVDAADAAGETVKVAAGVYGKPTIGSDQVVIISKTLNLRGGYTTAFAEPPDPQTNPTILDAGGAGRVVYLQGDASLEGFDLRNGVLFISQPASGGAGLYIESGSPVIRNNRIYRNAVSGTLAYGGGGGLYIRSGSPLVQANSIYSNAAMITDTASASSGGGGLYIYQGNARVENNVIRANTVYAHNGPGGGGGIYVSIQSSDVAIRGNVIAANSATVANYPSGGGGLHLEADQVLVAYNDVYDNRLTMLAEATKSGGGGLFVGKSSHHPTILRNRFYSNTVVSNGALAQFSGGGGLYLLGAAEALVDGNQVDHNTAAGLAGGGLAVLEDELNQTTLAVIQNNLVYANSAADGGGLYVSRGIAGNTRPHLVNNTLYNNRVTGLGGGIYSDNRSGILPVISNTLLVSNAHSGLYNAAATPITLAYSLVWNNPTSPGVASVNVLLDDPLLVNPARSDFHLQAGSPAIDAADPQHYPSTDLAGYARPFGAHADMGAYEFYSGACFARLARDAQIYGTVQAAVDAAIYPTDVVKVAGDCMAINTYGGGAQALYISKTLTVRGGYTVTDWLTPNLATYPTMLKAGGPGRVVYISGDISPTLEGLHLSGGDAGTAQDGGGLYVDGAAPMLVNLVITGNTARYGGGAYLANSIGGVLADVILIGNTASAGGGGLAADSSHAQVANLAFIANAAGASGGGGLYAASGSGLDVANSIIWSNTAVAGAQVQASGSLVTVTYSLVQGGYPGNGNVDSDPRFSRSPYPGGDGVWGTSDDDYGDLRLQAASPAIDAGANAALPADSLDLDGDGDTLEALSLDLAGMPRLIDHPQPDSGQGDPPVVDMGVYETTYADLRMVKGVDVSGSTLPGLAVPGQRITYSLAFDNAGPYTALYATITDALPVELTDIAYTSSGAPITPTGIFSYVWQVADLPPGQGGLITITGRVNPNLAASLSFSNTALIAAASGDTGAADNTSTADVAVVVLDASPVLTVNTGLTLTGGATATIGPLHLLATDAGAAALTYTLQAAPAYGDLRLNGIPILTGGAFSQADINAGRLAYVHGGTLAGFDVFTFTLSDGPLPTARVSLDSAGAQANGGSSVPAVSADGRSVAFVSDASNLVGGDSNGLADVFVYDRVTGQTTRVSLDSAGAQANGASVAPALSADGRMVAFVSEASNLVSGDSNSLADIFVHDRVTGQTTRVSVDSAGAQANGGSAAPALSADGRTVAFESDASNLVVSDTNGLSDVFVHDRITGQMSRVSLSSGGVQGDGHSAAPALSADGRYVAFESEAGNLVSDDSNGLADVFVHDRSAGQTARVSLGAGGAQANGNSAAPTLSADGRFVAFESGANNLVGGDGNGQPDVFVYDRSAGQTTRVSVNSSGMQANAASADPALSADGRTVVFASEAGNLVSGDSNSLVDIFARDRLTGQTTRLSLNADDAQADGLSSHAAASADGRFVAFASEAGNLVSGDSNGLADVFVRDRGAIRAAFEIAILFPDLRIAKSHTPAQPAPGQALMYHLVFSNAGGATAPGVVITDLPPIYLQQLGFQTSPGLVITPTAGVTYAWTLPDLAPGAGGVISLSAYLSSPLPAGLTFTNTASIATAAADSFPPDNQASVSMTVPAVPPLAVTDVVSTPEDTPLTIMVRANDSDPNGDLLSVTGVGQPGHGAASTDGLSVMYTPTLDFFGADTFTYTLNDGSLSAEGQLVVQVVAVNDAPLAAGDVVTTLEDTLLSITVLANDSDVDNATLFVAAVSAPVHGSVSISAAQFVVYTPDLDFYGLDVFSYVVSDGALLGSGALPPGALTATANVTVNVLPANDLPIARDDLAYTLEDQPVVVDVLANDTDTENDPLYVAALGQPAHGAAAISGTASLVYTPALNFYGADTFTYTVSDGHGLGGARVTVVVTPLANLSILKSAASELSGSVPPTASLPLLAAPGQRLTYTLAFSNAGHITATGVVISDRLAYLANAAFSAAGATVTPTSDLSYTWQVADLAPGAGGLIVVSGRVTGALAAGQSFTNTASITTTSVDKDPADNTSSAGARVPDADLVITKTGAPQPVTAGTALVYTITIANLGPDPALGLVFSDTLPPSTTLTVMDQTDDNDGGATPGFEDGAHANTRWSDPRPTGHDDEWLELADTALLSGTFTSRLIGSGSLANWSGLDWTPARPYGKELPGDGQAESAYGLGDANMASNRVLLHLNESSGTAFSDDSGLTHLVVCPATPDEACPTPGAEGRFGGALSFNGLYSQTVAISDTADPTRYALEVWVRPAVVTDTSFILRTDAAGAVSSTLANVSYLLGLSGGRFVHMVNDGHPRSAVGATPVEPGRWYHLVGTAESGGDIKLYVNGQEDARLDGVGRLWTGGEHYRLGSAYGPTATTRYFSGELDELAIYSRTLSAGEVNDHYLRGALRLGLQVRACDDLTCAGQDFAGPGGLTTSLYSELDNSGLGLPAPILTPALYGRYFQYRAYLASDAPDYSPRLQRVSVNPPHETITATQGDCAASDLRAFACTLDTLAAGQALTIVARVNVHPSALGLITNTAIVTALTPDRSLPNTATFTSTVVALSDLDIGKDDAEDPVNLGGQVAYGLYVYNRGPSTALSLTITDTMPLDLIGFAQGRDGWMCSSPGHVITCTVPRLEVGEHWDVARITLTAPYTETLITNTAWLTSALTPVYTTTALSATERTRITPLADLELAKLDRPDPVDPGAILTYTLTVTNSGPYTATQVRLTDTLPSALAGVSWGSAQWLCQPDGDDLVCTLPGELPPGQTAHLVITASAPLTGFLINQAVVGSVLWDDDIDDNSVIAYTAVRPVADLFVLKADSPDPVNAAAPLTYTLTLTNAGPAAAGALASELRLSNDQAMDIPWRGRAWPYPSSLNLSSIPGFIRDITVTLNGLSHAYPADLSVVLVGPGGRSVVLMSNAGGGRDVDDLTLRFNDAGPALPLSGTLTSTHAYRPTSYGLPGDLPEPAPAGPYGGTLAAFRGASPNGAWRLYVYDSVDSIGGRLADGWSLHLVVMTQDTIWLTDTLPAGLTGVQVTPPPGWTCAWPGGLLACQTDALGLADVARFTLSASAPVTGGLITNTVVVTSTTADFDPTFNTALVTTTVLSVSDLGLVKRVSPSIVEPGGWLTYTLSISNHGPSPIMLPVVVSDSLPAGLSAAGLSDIGLSADGWQCLTASLPLLRCQLPALPPGPAPDILITARAPLTSDGRLVLTNTAVVTAQVNDPDLINNSAFVTLTVGDQPIAGLLAFNSSPTVLGRPTFLTATTTAGTHVSFTWDFGDGQPPVAGNPLSHTYSAVGVYTAVVTAANSRGSLTATTRVIIQPHPTFSLYLPMICYNCVFAPDLVVERLVVSSDAITVTIRNQGNAPVTQADTHEFWVDVYIDPDTPPSGVGHWELHGQQGLAWGVTQEALPLQPGQALTLTARAGVGLTETVGGAYFRTNQSLVTWTLPAGVQVWAQVDSTNYPTTTYGTVLEIHEIMNWPYNNIVGPQSPTAWREKEVTQSYAEATQSVTESEEGGRAVIPVDRLKPRERILFIL